jgi:DNA-binding NarL/FixJ family response regulator
MRTEEPRRGAHSTPTRSEDKDTHTFFMSSRLHVIDRGIPDEAACRPRLFRPTRHGNLAGGMLNASVSSEVSELEQRPPFRARVMVAESHKLVADAIGMLLAAHYDVVGIVNDGQALLNDVLRLGPHVVLLGLMMPPPAGVPLIGQLRQRAPSTRLVVVTMKEDPVLAAATFRAGALGFVLKRCQPTELMCAVSEAIRGRAYLTPSVAGGIINALIESDGDDAERLTTRQVDVLRLLAAGRSMKEAASSLNVTARTIAFHKYAMMERLNLKSTAELVRFAVRRGLC